MSKRGRAGLFVFIFTSCFLHCFFRTLLFLAEEAEAYDTTEGIKGRFTSGIFFYLILLYPLFRLARTLSFFPWQRDMSRECDDGARWTFQRPFLFFFILLPLEQPQAAKNKKAGSLRK